MATMPVADFNGTSVLVEKPLPPGQTSRANSRPVTISTEDLAALIAALDAVDIATMPAVTVNGIPTTAADRGAGASTANTTRVVIVNEQSEGSKYQDIAASQPSTTLGSVGAGAYLAGITVIPESLDPGAITLQDGALTAVTIFGGGTASVNSKVPFWIPLGNTSVNGAWKVVTGAALHIRATGNF